MSDPKLNRADAIIQAEELMATAAKIMKEAKLDPKAQADIILENVDADKMAEILSQGATNLPKQAQKELGQNLTKAATKEEKAEAARQELAKTILGGETECDAIRKMTPAQLAGYTPKHVKRIIHTPAGMQFKAGKMEAVIEAWDFGTKPGSVSRAGGSLDKRPVKADRYIFPNNKKGALSLAGVDYRFATSVCKALGITWGRDSAARVLASAALEAKAGAKVLSVEYTPTEGPSVALKVRAEEAKKLGLLDARPEDK